MAAKAITISYIDWVVEKFQYIIAQLFLSREYDNQRDNGLDLRMGHFFESTVMSSIAMSLADPLPRFASKTTCSNQNITGEKHY